MLELKQLAIDGFDEKHLDHINSSGAFCVLMEAEIGTFNQAGADLFRFSVCNRSWLEANPAEMRHGFKYLEMEVFDLDDIRELVQSRLFEISEKLPEADWKTLAMEINQWANWEYENEARFN